MSKASAPKRIPAGPKVGGRRVFIIHGRDLKARDELAKFVRALGLEVLRFEDVATRLTGRHFIAEIVNEGIQQANAVIALFTPDEQAALYSPETGVQEGRELDRSRWQARPNVIFETGVAFAIARERTILATLGADVALLSDLSGLHVVELHKEDAKELLRAKLDHILGGVSAPVGNWKSVRVSGNFLACLRPRWPHYDELGALEADLSSQELDEDWLEEVPEPAPRTLLDVLRGIALRHPKRYARANDSTALLEDIEAEYSDQIADFAFWWFIVLGVLRYLDIYDWFEGSDPTWEDSLDNAELSERGIRLIAKLRLLHP